MLVDPVYLVFMSRLPYIVKVDHWDGGVCSLFLGVSRR